MDQWRLPGPSGFVEAVLESLREGSNVVIATSLPAASGIRSVLEDRIANEWRVTGPVDASGALPIDDLYGALEIDVLTHTRRNVASLMSAIDSKRVVIVCGVTTPQWAPWHRFIEEYASASRALQAIDRTQIVIIAAGVPKRRLPANVPALRAFAWDGFVGEADVFSYVIQAMRVRGKRIDAGAKLMARIVTRLGTWDVHLVDCLLELHPHELFEPTAALQAIFASDSSFRQIGATWEEGGVAEFDGEPSTHPAALLHGGDVAGELRMRLWAAQAAELLPALELDRRQIAKRMKAARLRLPVTLNGETFHDLMEIEIGQLLHLARVHRLPNDVIRAVEKLWRLRNKLAHLTPLTADEAIDFIDRRSA